MSSRLNTRPTKLEQALASDGAAPRPTPLDALRLARRRWFASGRIDMGELARELGVSRATLYSWVGSKERLIGEVIWSFAEEGIRQARAAAKGSGADRVADVFERFVHLNAEFDPLRRFIEQDPQLALRILTLKDGPVQERMIAVSRELLDEQVEAGKLETELDLDTLAYLLVRVAESFLYSDLINGSEPDVAQAAQAARLLLR